MKRRVSRLFVMLLMACAVQTSMADNAPFWLSSSLLDQTNTNTLGLSTASGAETVTVSAPKTETSSTSQSISSATIWARMVSHPVPISAAPMIRL